MNQTRKISSDLGATSLLPPHKADVAKCVGVVAILQSSFRFLEIEYKKKQIQIKIHLLQNMWPNVLAFHYSQIFFDLIQRLGIEMYFR